MRCTTYSIFTLFCLLFATATWGQNVVLEAKVFLQGPYQPSTMDDDLRTGNLLPLEEPYTALGYAHVGGGGGEQIDPAVLGITGNDAIVDWVVAELRQAGNPSNILASRAALLQRDGDVVDVNGSCPVRFEGFSPGNYYVAIRHRNHLGVMTQGVVNLQADPLDCIPDVMILDHDYVRDNPPAISDIDYYDRWGNGYTREELELKLYSGVSTCSNSGYFNLIFSTGFSAAEEAVICKVYQDLANLIIPADASSQVTINVNKRNFGETTTLATGTPYWDADVCSITNSDIERILIGGDPNRYGISHGEITINDTIPATNWSTDISASPNPSASTNINRFHLYTVVLHEALHSLGFASRIGINDGIYSQFDQFLYQATGLNNFLLQADNANPNCCDAHIVNPSASYSPSCNYFFRNGTNNIAPVNGANTNILNLLSHFNIDCPSSTGDYVMHPSLSRITPSNPTAIRNEVTCAELEALSLIGYNINTTVTSCGTLSSTACDALAIDDVFVYDDFANPITLSISSDILANDLVVGSTPNFSYDATGTGLSISQSGNTLSITASATGAYEIPYEVSSCNGRCDDGIITIIITACVADPLLNPCEGCNAICADIGNFECFSSEEEVRLFFSGGAREDGFYFGNRTTNSPDMPPSYNIACNSTPSSFPPLEGLNTAGIVTFGGNSITFSEGLVIPLCEPITTGETTTVSFLSVVPTECVAFNPRLRVAFLTPDPIFDQSVDNLIPAPQICQNIVVNDVINTYNITCTNTTPDDWNYLLLSGDIDFGAGGATIGIDDIQVTRQKQITITPNATPASACLNGIVTLQYELENPHCSPSSNLNINLNVPPELTLLSAGTFSSGSSSVNINEISPNSAVMVTALVQVGTSASNGDILNIPLIVTPTGCYQASNATAQINIVNNPIGMFTKTVTNSGSTYDIEITVCNSSTQTLMDINISDNIPSSFNITNNPDGFTINNTIQGTQLALSLDMLPPSACQTFTFQAMATTTFCTFESCARAEILNSGCDSENSCFTYNDTSAPTPIASFTALPSCSPPSVSFTSSNNDPSWTHEWEFGDVSMGTSNLANPNYTYANEGTYYVIHTVTDACGNTDDEEIMIVVPDCFANFECSCTNSTPIGNPAGGDTDISTTVVGTTYGNAGACLQVAGRIVIDQNTGITGGEIVFEAGAEIYVPNGRQLTILNVNLHSCDNNLWNGIVVENGGTLNFAGNTISDADVAIELNTNSTFNIQSNTFDRNRTGVLVLGTPIKVAFTNNLFDASSLLNNGSTGLVGLRVKNAYFPMGNISPSTAETNTFRRLHYGVVAENSLVLVIDAVIENLNYDSSTRLLNGSDNNGLGILGINNANLRITQCQFNDLHEGVRCNDSQLLATNSVFNRVDQGIEVVNLINSEQLEIRNNTMDVSAVGIHLENILSSSVNEIEDNTINIDWFANQIVAGNTTPYTGSAVEPRGVLVSLFGDNSGLNQNLSITNNTFNMQLESASTVDPNIIAVDLISCNGVNIIGNQTNGIPDPITNSGLSQGLALNDCTELVVSDNVFWGTRPPTIAITAVNAHAVSYCCNELESVSVGFDFFGMCDPSYINQNDIGDAPLTGLLCEPTTIIGEQVIFDNFGNPIQHRGNAFTGTTYNFGARHQGTALEVFGSQIHVPDDIGIYYPPTSSTVRVSPIDFFQINPILSTPATCDLLAECQDVDAGPTDITYSNLVIAGGSGTTSRGSNGFASEMLNWEGGKALFAKLKRHPELLGKESVIDAYWLHQDDMKALFEVEANLRTIGSLDIDVITDLQRQIEALEEEIRNLTADYEEVSEYEQRTIRTLAQEKVQIINSLIEQQRALRSAALLQTRNTLSIANQINASFQAEGRFATIEQFLNRVYLNYLLNPDTDLDSRDIDQLYEIADECYKVNGGTAIRARAIYKLLVGEAEFKNIKSCEN